MLRSFIFLFFLLLSSAGLMQAQRLRFHPMHHELALLPVGWGQVSALQTGASWPAAPGSLEVAHQGYGLYKYHFNKFQAVRTGVGYESVLQRTADELNLLQTENRTTAAVLRAGYEHKLPLGRFQLYGGGELAYAIGQSVVETTSEQGSGSATSAFQDARIQGVAGIRFFANKHLSFQLENTLSRSLQIKSAKFTANWLQFGVSIHGKKMKKKCTCGKPGS